MKKRLVFLTLAALSGGQFVSAASPVPVVERTANGSPAQPATSSAGNAPAASVGSVQPRSRPAAPALNPAAELLLMVDQLQEEVRFLRGRVEEQENLLRRMREDQRDRYRDLDRRITLVSEQQRQAPAPLMAAPTPLATASAPVNSVGSAAATPIKATPGIADTDAYKEAFALVRQRNYPQALLAFEQFLATYPSSALVPNVLYWSGEVQRAKGEPDLAAAEQAYAELLQRFPDHGKAPDAYYKLGLTYDAQGSKAKAREMMEAVIGRFPQQASAQLARDFLARQ